jgi:predicted DNA-binding ribbon-helix-helix protein
MKLRKRTAKDIDPRSPSAPPSSTGTRSVSLEETFWVGLNEIAEQRRVMLPVLLGAIDLERTEREQGNLSSALRLFVLDFYRSQLLSQPNARGP